MAIKATKTLRALTKDELLVKERELRAGLFDARMKKVTGQLENVSLVWQLRKNLARVKTLVTQANKAEK